ncbi:MAG: potassium transporter TrkG [Planctomycetaceae bacterium]
MPPTDSTRKLLGDRPPDSRCRSLVEKLARREKLFLVIGLTAAVMRRGSMYQEFVGELSLVVCISILVRVVRIWLDWWLSDNRNTFARTNLRRCLFTVTWTCGALILGVLGRLPPVWQDGNRFAAIVGWSELFLLLAGISWLLLWVSSMTTRTSPAKIFVYSFVGLIFVGTALLMLPGSQTDRVRQDDLAERLRNAVFTSTSASCVTGLVTVETGGEDPYWTRFGQFVILGLFQIGGLGIMSLGATYTLLIGRSLAPRHSTAVTEVTEAVTMGDVRSLLLSILAVTLFCEAIGAVLMMTLWPELPVLERIFFGAFHSVSAFCNAGFSLTSQSFMEHGTHWQVWGVLSLLIIIGGLGFGTLQSLFSVLRSWFTDRRERESLFAHRRPTERLPLSSRIILWMSLLLCAGGAIGFFLLEATGPETQDSVATRCAQAWFQSVTFRTAGFNTVDHGELQPATKLFAVGLMFIGAAPGSTGGGVKVVAVGIIALALMSILKGRRNVEYHGRTIPDQQVRMAFVIIAMGLATTLTATLLLTLFESDEPAFLNHLFEATSAYATVGVSTGITADLSPVSQIILIITMFLGRVGPLTVLIALTDQQDVSYQYPSERVALG